MKGRVVVFTLGCKVKRYESDLIIQQLRQSGYEVSEDFVPADIYILNTCAVTAEAERKSRQAVRRCRAVSQYARIYVLGCASQNHPRSFIEKDVTYVAGTAGKIKIVELLEETPVSNVSPLPLLYEAEPTLIEPNRTRAYVKLQDGCDSFCSYCLIPYVRGRSRSKALDTAVSEIYALDGKTDEIVLTGINTMRYGMDIGTDLPTLIEELSGITARLRFSSFYVEGISERLLSGLFGLKNFCPHFHLSLQSGDEEVLRAMNRHYTPMQYAEKVKMIRAYDDNSALTTDIIAGFPTETENNHNNTVKFINEIAFADIHVFPYSRRTGTAACKYTDLPSETVKKRRDELLAVKSTLKKAYSEKNIGIPQSVLFEEKVGEFSCGYSERYIRIYVKGSYTGVLTVVPVALYKDGLIAEVK